MKRCYTLFIAVTALLLLSLSVSADSGPVSVIRQSSGDIGSSAAVSGTTDRAVYTGKVRTYITEPSSRWRDNDGANFNFGFLDWGPVADLNLADGARWEQSMTWNAATAGFGTISSSNIQVTAAVFTSAQVLTDAYPNYGYWFMANYCDASAAATPGHPGYNETATGFTHSVFLEEGTATW